MGAYDRIAVVHAKTVVANVKILEVLLKTVGESVKTVEFEEKIEWDQDITVVVMAKDGVGNAEG